MAFQGKKTQIYVTEEQWRRLRRESGLAGVSVAEVIRQSIDDHLKTAQNDDDGFTAALSKSAGVWRDRDDITDSEQAVRHLRKGWSARENREIHGRLSD